MTDSRHMCDSSLRVECDTAIARLSVRLSVSVRSVSD